MDYAWHITTLVVTLTVKYFMNTELVGNFVKKINLSAKGCEFEKYNKAEYFSISTSLLISDLYAIINFFSDMLRSFIFFLKQ